MRITCGFFIGMSVLLTFSAQALEVSKIFSSDMVLQRGKSVKVWGEAVAVTINGQTVKATASDGVWKIALKPMKAGGPYAMRIKGSKEIVFENILVGEWSIQEVVMNDNHAKITLNGTVILEDTDIGRFKRPSKGHVGFLGHGCLSQLRNIRIRELKQ